MIDLHSHSTFSDGTATPTQIIEQAQALGLSAIALTDHDTAAGLKEFQTTALKYPLLTAINGAELGVDFQGDESFAHLPEKPVIEIIAMNFKDTEPYLQWGKRIQAYRQEANFKRVEKLRALGMDIDYEEVILDKKGHPRNMVGKPHIAAVMLKKGYIASIAEAFTKYLNRGLPAYVKQQNPTEVEALDFIRQTGAVPILPHPCLTKTKGQGLFNLIKYLKYNGLMGIEVFHSEHSQEQMKEYFGIAKELNLIISGGSDYHGKNKPDIQLGTGRKNLSIPNILLEPIMTFNPRKVAYNGIEKALINNRLQGRAR